MKTQTGKTCPDRSRSAAEKSANRHTPSSAFRITDNRPEVVAQRKLQEAADNSSRAQQNVVQRVTFDKAERFKKTFTSQTGLTGYILGEGGASATQAPPTTHVPQAPQIVQAPPVAQVPQVAAAAPNHAVQAPQTVQAPQNAAGAAAPGDQALREERQKLVREHSWHGQKTQTIGVNEVWINANHSGVAGGTGMTGNQGQAIWLSRGDVNAQYAYGAKSSNVVHEYKPKRPLRVAVLAESMVVFPPDDRDWVRLFPDIDGAITDYGNGKAELAVFNIANLTFVQTRGYAAS